MTATLWPGVPVTVTFTVPPAAATSRSPAFNPLTASNGIVLVNNQEARLDMPIGGIVQANRGLFAIASAVPNVTPTSGATEQTIATGGNATTVTLSADAAFFFTIQSIRR